MGMTPRELKAAAKEAIAWQTEQMLEEDKIPKGSDLATRRWWVSFAERGEFRGICIVLAPDVPAAMAKISTMGANPGGTRARAQELSGAADGTPDFIAFTNLVTARKLVGNDVVQDDGSLA